MKPFDKNSKILRTCLGYNRVCWASKSSTSDKFCSSCDKEKSLHEIKILVNNIINDREKLEPNIYPLFRKAIQYDGTVIDTQIVKMIHKKEFRRFYNWLEQDNIYNIILLRYRNHTGGELCKLYKMRLQRNRDYEVKGYHIGELLPQNCIGCMGNCIAWGKRNGLAIEARKWFLSTVPDKFVVSAHRYYKDHRDEYFEVMNKVLYKILDYSYALYLNIVPRVGDRDILRRLEYHPQTFRTEDFRVLREKLREWISEYKEELIAKSWHPSRMQEWCLDQEDQAEIGYTNSLDMNINNRNTTRSRIGNRGSCWNIDWSAR